MKVVFLDIDGVLNNFALIRANGFDYIDEAMVRMLGSLVGQTGASVVLSSFWRLDPKDRALVDRALGVAGMAVVDRTPSIPGDRAAEISQWLRSKPEVRRFAILDDDEGAGAGLEHSFFQTDPDVGITHDIVRRAVLHLNGGQDD